MQNQRKTAASEILLATVAGGLVVLSCLHEFNNPNDPAYRGDYGVEASWNSLPASLEVLRTYAIPFSQGKDAYDSLVTDAPVNLALLNESYAGEDSLRIRFNAAYTGDLRIACFRPNGKVDSTDAVSLVVDNPYEVDGGESYGTGDTARLSITRDSGAIRADWRVVWNGADTLQASEVLAEPVNVTHEVTAAIIDEYGALCALTPVTVTAAGVRPTITSLTLPSAISQGDTLTVTATVTGTTGGKFRLILTANDSVLSDTVAEYNYGQRSIRCVAPVIDTGEVIFAAIAGDAASPLRSAPATTTRRISYIIPTVHFADSAPPVATGHIYTVDVASDGAMAYLWWSAGLSVDTSTERPSLSLFIQNTGAETLYVRGVNAWGLKGPVDTLVIRARAFTYVLDEIALPTSIAARHWAVFAVQAVENAVPVSNASYVWAVAPPADSTNTNSRGDSLRLWFQDSIPGVDTIRVKARIAADSTPTITRLVTVRRFAPAIAFNDTAYPAGINERVEMTVDTADGNGRVVEIFYRWRTAGGTWEPERSVGTSTTIADTFIDTGTFEVEVRCVDDDGFSSPRDTALVHVTADKPRFTPRTSIDTAAFINDTMVFGVAAVSGAAGETVDRYVWREGDSTLQDGASDRLTTAFSDPGIHTITVRAFNSLGDSSAGLFTITVDVDAGRPAVDSAWLSTTLTCINTPVTLKAWAHDTNGVVARIDVDTSGDYSPDLTIGVTDAPVVEDSAVLTFPGSGTYVVRTQAVDEDGQKSDWFLADTVEVNNGEPVADSVTPNTAYLSDAQVYTIRVHDNGTVDSFRLSANGTTGWGLWRVGRSLDTAFSDTGWAVLYVRVKDNDGMVSGTLHDSVLVRSGRPVIEAVTIDTAESMLFVADPRRYIVTASDPNDSVRKIFVSWDGDTVAEDSLTVTAGASVVDTFTHTYPTSEYGPRSPLFWARDADGFLSPRFSKDLVVRRGRPRVTALTTDSAVVWVHDSVAYTVTASDTNGSTPTMYISFDNGASFRSYAGQSMDTVLTSAGAKDVKAFVLDNDGISSDTLSTTVVVHLGAPKVDSLRVDTTANNLFVRDNRIYTVHVSDTNGTVVKLLASWNGESTPQESLTVNISRNGSGQFTHAYDTTGGSMTARFWVRDEDGVVSGSRDSVLVVRKAAPVLWGDAGDTVWVVVDSGVGRNYPIRINSFDTNGVANLPTTWYWNEAGPALGRATARDTVMRNFSAGDLVVPFGYWIYARDNDSLTRGGGFVVFADSAPPRPAVLDAGGSGNPVAIAWSGKDTKDGDGTLYQILLRKGTTEPATSDSLFAFRAGSSFVSGSAYSKDYRYDFTPAEGNGEYHYKVIAKDARGTESISNDGTFFY